MAISALFVVGRFGQRNCQPRQRRSDTEAYRGCTDEHQHHITRRVAVTDQGRDAQRLDVGCEECKGETDGNSHCRVAGNLQQK